MNFRTTLVLLVLVVAAGIMFFVTNRKASENEAGGQTAANERKLLDVDSKDVTRVAVTNSEGKRTVLEKTGANWHLVEPVKAGAKDFEVDSLVNDLTGLQSRGQVDPSQKSAAGLDHPSFTVELTGKNGKVTKLLVGEKQQIGDTLLVQVNDNKKPDVVATTIYAQLDKPASNYRKSQLVEITQDQIKQLTLTKGKSTIKLQKKGTDWQVIEPKQMPADTSAMSDLLFGITGLNAAEFVTDDAARADNYGLNRPRMTVWYSTQAPSTQPAAAATTAPATQPGGGTEIRFGDYEDVLKKNLFAEVDRGPIAKVLASNETTFNKTALDLRDKNLVSIEPEKVQSITIQVTRAATTQPTTMPAELRGFAIERRKEEPKVLGPILPATTEPATTQSSPATQVAGTQPTTQPAAVPATQPAATQPASKWIFASGQTGDAEEGQVNALLTALHPLHVDKYQESAPTTQPAGSFTLAIHTSDGKDYSLHFTDPGNNAKVIGGYDELTFEIDRSLIDKISGDFKTRKAEISPPPSFGGAGGMPFGGGQ
jgi:hypothetical protein